MEWLARSGLLLAAAAALTLGASLPTHAAGVGPGAYCPLPEPGQRPKCLEPARAAYGEVFDGLDEGQVSDAQLRQLEADMEAGAASENRYVALSSLTYAYYRLAELEANAPGQDPVVVERLQRWNRLLARAFESSSQDSSYQEAMLTAAHDLQARAPTVTLSCVDADGEQSPCDSTEALLRGFDAASSSVGIRGALESLLQRIVQGDDS